MPGGNHNGSAGRAVNPNKGFSPNKVRAYGSTKELVARAIDQVGGADHAALVLDRSAQTIYAYTDETRNHDNLSYHGARRLTQLGHATCLAEDLAGLAGGVFVPLAVDDTAHKWPELGGLASAEFAQFIQVLLRALADSKINDSERARLKREVDDVIHIMAEARAKLGDAPESDK